MDRFLLLWQMRRGCGRDRRYGVRRLPGPRRVAVASLLLFPADLRWLAAPPHQHRVLGRPQRRGLPFLPLRALSRSAAMDMDRCFHGSPLMMEIERNEKERR